MRRRLSQAPAYDGSAPAADIAGHNDNQPESAQRRHRHSAIKGKASGIVHSMLRPNWAPACE
jgi:hypothetical protein